MADVLAAHQALEDAKAQAKALIAAAQMEFGKALYEARHQPPHLDPPRQDDIAEKVGLGRERLRQIENEYRKTLSAA